MGEGHSGHGAHPLAPYVGGSALCANRTTPRPATVIRQQVRQHQIQVAIDHTGNHLLAVTRPDVFIEYFDLHVARVTGVGHPSTDRAEVDVTVAHHAPR